MNGRQLPERHDNCVSLSPRNSTVVVLTEIPLSVISSVRPVKRLQVRTAQVGGVDSFEHGPSQIYTESGGTFTDSKSDFLKQWTPFRNTQSELNKNKCTKQLPLEQKDLNIRVDKWTWGPDLPDNCECQETYPVVNGTVVAREWNNLPSNLLCLFYSISTTQNLLV